MTKQIKKVLDQYAQAVWNKDVAAFLELYDDTIQVYDAWGHWEYAGKEEFRTLPLHWFNDLGSDRVKVNFKDPQIHENGDLGSIWTEVNYAAFDEHNKLLHAMSNRLTMVLKKRSDDWKIIHEHTSIPVDMETGQGMFKILTMEKKTI